MIVGANVYGGLCSDSEEDDDRISKRLYTERLKATGRHFRSIAPTIAEHNFTEEDITSYGGPKVEVLVIYGLSQQNEPFT